MLQTYTFEELLYEFYDQKEREDYRQQNSKENSDKIEADRLQESLDWAEQEELRELEEYKAQQAKKQNQSEDTYKPTAEDEAWMEKVMKEEQDRIISKGKEQFGDDFGEDMTGSFEDGE